MEGIAVNWIQEKWKSDEHATTRDILPFPDKHHCKQRTHKLGRRFANV